MVNDFLREYPQYKKNPRWVDTTRSLDRSRVNYPPLRKNTLSYLNPEEMPKPVIPNSLKAPNSKQTSKFYRRNNGPHDWRVQEEDNYDNEDTDIPDRSNRRNR
jgi:hypothetical protein